jgi:hypothetical protein
MALHCDADMVRPIVGARQVKLLSGHAGSQGQDALAQAFAAKRPNSIRRVLSGWSDSANFPSLSRIASRKRRASLSCSKPAPDRRCIARRSCRPGPRAVSSGVVAAACTQGKRAQHGKPQCVRGRLVCADRRPRRASTRCWCLERRLSCRPGSGQAMGLGPRRPDKLWCLRSRRQAGLARSGARRRTTASGPVALVAIGRRPKPFTIAEV